MESNGANGSSPPIHSGSASYKLDDDELNKKLDELANSKLMQDPKAYKISESQKPLELHLLPTPAQDHE